MTNQDYMIIDGITVPIEGEKNVLAVIRKANVQLPTFCYYSELSVYGACRMCMFEDERGELDTACSATPRSGMSIKTNTQRLRRYRKNILELLLANHCRDCTTCQNSGECKLQELAKRFDMTGVRFPNAAEQLEIDNSSVCITRDASKCILCGDCVRMCSEVQRVGAIDFAHRGSDMAVSCAFGIPLAESNCVGCGQCAAVCPTGAIIIKNDLEKVWADIDDSDTHVTVQIAPAVRAAIGREFGLEESDNVIGKIVAALRRLGFDEVFDTSTGADLTVIEEAAEFSERLKTNLRLPLFTSCCPAWIQYCENNYPELMEHVSTCKSPMQMFASVIKANYKGSKSRQSHVAVMPCTAKKYEAVRPEFSIDGTPYVDRVITTKGLIRMICESGISFEELEPEALDVPFFVSSGAGVIFGVTGGVTEAVLRNLTEDKSQTAVQAIAYTGIRGMQGIKEATVTLGGRVLRIAVVSGLGNAAALIEKIKQGEHFDFVEVMACPGGCISGAGQPYARFAQMEKRGQGLYIADKSKSIKHSENNPVVHSLYDGELKCRSHDMLHVDYKRRSE